MENLFKVSILDTQYRSFHYFYLNYSKSANNLVFSGYQLRFQAHRYFDSVSSTEKTGTKQQELLSKHANPESIEATDANCTSNKVEPSEEEKHPFFANRETEREDFKGKGRQTISIKVLWGV